MVDKLSVSEIADQLQRESEHEYLLDRIAETFRIGLLAAELDSTIFWCNPAMAQCFGYSVSSLVGQNLDVFLGRDRRTWHRGRVRDVGEGLEEISIREVRARHRKGHEVSIFLDVRGIVYKGRRIVVAATQEAFLAEKK